MMKLPIANATDAQLREFAALTLQLDGITDESTRPEIEAAIQTAWPNDFIYVEGPQHVGIEALAQNESVAPATFDVEASNSEYRHDPRVGIRIHETELPGGKHPVSVAVNGKTLVIQRNMDVKIPYRFFEALQRSVHVSVDWNPKTNEITETPVTRFPITVDMASVPSPAEIEKWRQLTNELEAA